MREKRETESLKQLDGGAVVFFARNEQLRLSRFLCTGNERCKWQPVLRGMKASCGEYKVRRGSGRPVWPRINGALTPCRSRRGGVEFA